MKSGAVYGIHKRRNGTTFVGRFHLDLLELPDGYAIPRVGVSLYSETETTKRTTNCTVAKGANEGDREWFEI